MLRVPLALLLAQQLRRGAVVEAAIAKDAVPTLPGLFGALPSKLWSGYLEPSPGHMLHYVFMESWSNPSADPVAAWMAMGRSVIQMPLSIIIFMDNHYDEIC